MATAVRFLRALPLLVLSPFLIAIPAVLLALTDLCFALFGRRRAPADTLPNTAAASVVIPNWNGRDLLEKYIPSIVTALAANPANEIIVVDNGSTDGSAELLRQHFPTVRVLALPKNLGFGGGSNAGFRAAQNDIVVLLNSDMRVDPGFLQPLLNAFTDPLVFAVSCQIFFSDPNKPREETGLTQAWWENGGLRVRHRLDDQVTEPYPCFYGGGGSCAFDRRKFLELGGFDELLKPFYLEDTDIGYLAWKRGWKVLYEPRSIVFHEHRGTIGKKFSPAYIQSVVLKNFVLFCWKNIHEPARIASHFLFAFAGALLSVPFGDSLERPNLTALARAFLQTPTAMRSRWRSRSLATIDDTEAFRRPMAGYFRDRFHTFEPAPARPNVLFISPYPIAPPIHGGAVFMYQTTHELVRYTNLHLIVLIDTPEEQEPHDALAALCGSAEFLLRLEGQPRELGSILPHAINEYANRDLEWLIHRQVYLKRIDAIQFDYLPMGQYFSRFRNIAQFLFEHDVYFQSVGRLLGAASLGVISRATTSFEYLRALRYELELLPNFDRVQVCSPENKSFVTGFRPDLAPILDDDLRAGITVSRYKFADAPRDPNTMLFLGSFRHLPNTEALRWFVHNVLPIVLERNPAARLTVIGSDPPPGHSFPAHGHAIDLRGFVADINEPLARSAVFLCPILSGSGVRVKLLEAFASGIPVVSTRLGAEGLATEDGDVCRLADDPQTFAEAVLEVLANPALALEQARRARQMVERRWDMAAMTERLAASYRDVIARKRRA